MEKKDLTLGSNSVAFGLLTAFALIGLTLLLFVLNMNESPIRWLGFGILIGGMAYGTVNFRDKAKNGFITYGKAFGSCYLILLFASILLSIFFYVYIGMIDHSVIVKGMAQAEENMRQKGMDDDQIAKAMKMAQKFMTPGFMSVILFVMYQFLGTILALLAAIFIRKDNPNPFDGVSNTDSLDQVR